MASDPATLKAKFAARTSAAAALLQAKAAADAAESEAAAALDEGQVVVETAGAPSAVVKIGGVLVERPLVVLDRL